MARKTDKAESGIKRAGIYVRVSTEKQAEKVSPQEQEKACRAYCEDNGYLVAEVYRDVERYKVGKTMVEPSGTRADRPQLRRMLAAVDDKALDVIVAWREDRLYRGLKPMLPVIECIERNKITIELVTETFDAKMAPIKASIARMELEGIKERHSLGRAALLAQGKPWSGRTLPYGYRRGADGYVEAEPVEAAWVRQVCEWYADGTGITEIRRRLMLQAAPQRGDRQKTRGNVKVDWAISVIHRMTTYEMYWTGKQAVTMASGQSYDIPVPVLVEPELAQRVQERRRQAKAHPARNKKYGYLLDGLIYCEGCGRKMTSKTRTMGGGVLRASYSCPNNNLGYVTGAANCAKYNTAKPLEDKVWTDVWAMISDDELFLARIDAKIKALQVEEADAETALSSLQARLDDISIKRQRVINWANNGVITEEDMALQLGGLTMEAEAIKREAADKSLLVGNRAQRLVAFANLYRAQLRDGRELLTMAAPMTEEEAAEQLRLRRKVVDAIVTRVDVRADKTPVIKFEFDLRGMEPAGDAVEMAGDIKTQPYWRLRFDIPVTAP